MVGNDPSPNGVVLSYRHSLNKPRLHRRVVGFTTANATIVVRNGDTSALNAALCNRGAGISTTTHENDKIKADRQISDANMIPIGPPIFQEPRIL